MKTNWKVLDGQSSLVMVFQHVTQQKSETLSAINLMIAQKNIHDSILFSNFHCLDRVDIYGKSMYFRHEAVTEIVESSLLLNREGSLNNI